MHRIDKLKEKAVRKKNISTSEALDLFVEGTGSPYRVLAAASEIREHFKGKDIILCGMTHSTSEKCSENCRSCAQSSSDAGSVPSKKIKTAKQIIDEAVQAKKDGAEFFSIITSGDDVKTKTKWTNIYKAIAEINKLGIKTCLSAGIIDADQAEKLKAAGHFHYYLDLKNARNSFNHLSNGYDCKDDLATINSMKAAGLSVCAGVFFSRDESFTQRIQLAEALRKLNVDSISIQLIDPIKEKPHDRMHQLSPMEILMTIAVFRFMLPDKDINLCGSKKQNLRQLLPLGIIAGANSLMTGNYLTTMGRDSKRDHEMITDLGLIPTREIDLCKCGTKGKHVCSASSTTGRK